MNFLHKIFLIYEDAARHPFLYDGHAVNLRRKSTRRVVADEPKVTPRVCIVKCGDQAEGIDQ